MSSGQGSPASPSSPFAPSSTPSPFGAPNAPQTANAPSYTVFDSQGAPITGNPASMPMIGAAPGTPSGNPGGNNQSFLQQYSPPLVSHNMKLAGQLIPGINGINDFIQKPFAGSTALSAATFGLSDLFGIGRKNSSPIQDISAALAAGHPVTDSDWAKAGYGPNGAGLNGAPDYFSAQLGITGNPANRAPQYSNSPLGLPGNYGAMAPATAGQQPMPGQQAMPGQGPSLAQANPFIPRFSH